MLKKEYNSTVPRCETYEIGVLLTIIQNLVFRRSLIESNLSGI